ncbi:DotI/IcmL family type IV secretion protein [Pseudomonas aeruginosa]|uniref:DotI/IcmL family type IV secretion protein n=1 Tax=Pseudomonas aeruginosa TaxID=287 RepID=UPI0031B713D6
MVKSVLAAVAVLATVQAEAASDPHPLPLLKFAEQCVRKAFQLNYAAYERQLQDLHVECMTDPAYRDWRSSLQRVGIIDQLKSPKAALVLAVNNGPGRVIQEGVKTVGNLNRYTATVRTPVSIVFNGNVDRAPQGYVETDVIRVRQNDRIVGYAIHAIRLNIQK